MIRNAGATSREPNLFVKPMSPQDKMSAVLKEMALTIFIHPEKIPSSEAVAASLLFSHVAWNRSIGAPLPDKTYCTVLSDIETNRPNFWDEFKYKDRDIIISKLIAYKQSHYPDDCRVIDACMSLKGKVRVEWH